VSRREIFGPAALVGGFYAVLLIGLLGFARHDPRDFIEIGHRYIDRSHASAAIRVDPTYRNYLPGDGYDGQFYYFIALDPANAQDYIDAPIYRYERIVYPLLARLLAAGQASLIPATMIAINWLAVTGGTLAVAARLRASGASGWWAIVFGLAPGMYLALRRDLAEALAYALVALGIYLFYRGRARLPWSAIVFALAVLTRETTAVFPVILAAALVLENPRTPALHHKGTGRISQRLAGPTLFLAISILPFLLYRVALTIWLQGRGNIAPFEPIPFLGIIRDWPWSHRIWAEALFIVLPALIVAALSGVALWRRQISAMTVAVLVNVLLFVVFLGDASYVELTASARASVGVVLAAVLALPTLALIGRRRLWLWLAFALWLTPLPPLLFPPLGRALGVS